MNRQEKIEAIYEKIASKKLTFWCSFLCQKWTDKSWIRRVIIATIWDDFLTVFPDFPYQKITSHPFIDRVPKNCILKTIWHPVMIWDVLDFIYENEMIKFENTWISEIKEKLIKLWIWDLRNPIEEQSDECVDFVYDLIK